MVLRSAASFLLLLVCAVASPQTTARPASRIPSVFHDPALGITYFYPNRFTPVAPAKAKTQLPCAHETLAGSSVTPVGTSAFVFSTIDQTCPAILQAATRNLDAFTREQVFRQLKQYGKPVIVHDPARYLVDGHPAAITIASAEHPRPANVNNMVRPEMTYAAKACVLGEIPTKRGRSTPAQDTKHILCFDFTTSQHDLLPLLLAFTVQFDGRGPQPLVPGSILR
jgi:hypothetical protein